MGDGAFAIEARGLTKRFGRLLAVDGIDFDVRRGEVFGFLGPNGAGKTTTVMMLTTLLKPTAGTIRIEGHDISRDCVQAKARMGIVPEVSNVYTELSVRGNLLFSGKLYRLPRTARRQRAELLLRMFGLADKADVKAAELSKGMRRRLTVAMALVHEPTILFLDEPISGLDVRSARALKEMVREFNERGATIFLTTHQIEVANELCHRVAIINEGRIATVGTPEELKASIESVQAVEVLFADEVEKVPSLAGLAHVSREVTWGNRRRLFTDSPGEVIGQVVEVSRQRNLRLASINTLGPSLEDVFLKITGGEIGARKSPDDASDRRRKPRSGP